MTDKEIMDALEFCKDCSININWEIIDLINRQRAEIKWRKEALQTQTDILESGANSYEPCFEKDKIRAEAIKEFAEKLMTNIKEHYKRTAHGYSIAGWNYSVSDIEAFVHNLVKEMEGRQ